MVEWSKSLAYTFLFLYALTLVILILIPIRVLLLTILLVSLSTLFFFLFSLTHGWRTLGARRLLTLLGLTFLIALVLESVGVLTGWPYGPYPYTNRLGPRLLGLVPVPILLAWFMMVYAAQQVVERITASILPPRLTFPWVAWLVILEAMALTAWDLVMDPLMVSRAHWVWEVRGAYFGIPVQNYVGWMLTGILIYGTYYAIHARPAVTDEGDRGWRALPALAYLLTWVANIVVAGLAGFLGPGLVGFFAMGAFALLGLGAAFSPQAR